MKTQSLFLISLFILQFSSTSFAQCCEDAASCRQALTQLASVCKNSSEYSKSCEALHIITTKKLSLRNNDLSPLSSDQKDMAGTYSLNLGNMTLLNEWKAGDAEGITSEGTAVLSVKSLCVDPNNLNIKGSYRWFGFSFNFNTSLQSRKTKDQSLQGYEVNAGKKLYFFQIN